MVQQDRKVTPATRVRQDRSEILGLRVRPDLPDQSAQPVRRARTEIVAQQDQADRPVFPALTATGAHKANKATQGRPVLLE